MTGLTVVLGSLVPDILHRVGIDVPPERVFEALATIDGLRHWWVSETSGDPNRGRPAPDDVKIHVGD